MKFLLRRLAESPDGTFGHLDNGEGVRLTTAEEEGQGNKENVSRIPAGSYTCRRTTYHRYGYETFEVLGVEDRTRILFHPGNTEEDTAGCILVGMEMGMFEVNDEDTGEPTRKLGVSRSVEAFNVFMLELDGVEEFELEITDPEWKI